MDIQSLKRTATILADLVRGKNQTLVAELDERDRIKNEMTFKMKVINLIRKLEQDAMDHALALVRQTAQHAKDLEDAAKEADNTGMATTPIPIQTATTPKSFFKKFW